MQREPRSINKLSCIIGIITIILVYTVIEYDLQKVFKNNGKYVPPGIKAPIKGNYSPWKFDLVKTSLSINKKTTIRSSKHAKGVPVRTTVRPLTTSSAKHTKRVPIKNLKNRNGIHIKDLFKKTTVRPLTKLTPKHSKAVLSKDLKIIKGAQIKDLFKKTTVRPLTALTAKHTKDGSIKDLKITKSVPVKEKEATNQATSDLISEFALYLRMFYVKRPLYESMLVQSMRFFWTIKAPLVVVLDNTAMDIKFGKEIRQLYPFPEICHEETFPSHLYHGNGHNLQQLSMFHAEKCFHRKYIGFVDTDTLFVSIVTPEQLFIDGKPLLIGQYGIVADAFWYTTADMTTFALGKKEVFRCMSYFPVMMKVEHIIEMRNYVAKLHKTDFNSVFKRFSVSTKFSQFDIMCNYVWYFHRNEYVFHAQLRVNTGIWNGENTAPGRHGLDYYEKNVPREIRHPVARPAIHYRYSDKWKEQNTFRTTLKAGLCFSGGFDLCPNICQSFNRSALNKYMFLFDFSDWTWDNRCIIAQRNHIKNIGKLNKTETRERILLGCKLVDKLSFRVSGFKN